MYNVVMRSNIYETESFSVDAANVEAILNGISEKKTLSGDKNRIANKLGAMSPLKKKKEKNRKENFIYIHLMY